MKGAQFEAAVVRLWVQGLSSGQVAENLGVTRGRVIGCISRAGKRIEAKTGENPYARPNQRLNVQNGLGGLGMRPKKFKAPKPTDSKPAQIKRDIDVSAFAPGDPLPPQVTLDQRLWISLPGTSPKPLTELPSTGCKWPVDRDCITLFCGAQRGDNSPYCKTHHRWAHSQKKLEPLNFGKAA